MVSLLLQIHKKYVFIIDALSSGPLDYRYAAICQAE